MIDMPISPISTSALVSHAETRSARSTHHGLRPRTRLVIFQGKQRRWAEGEPARRARCAEMHRDAPRCRELGEQDAPAGGLKRKTSIEHNYHVDITGICARYHRDIDAFIPSILTHRVRVCAHTCPMLELETRYRRGEWPDLAPFQVSIRS